MSGKPEFAASSSHKWCVSGECDSRHEEFLETNFIVCVRQRTHRAVGSFFLKIFPRKSYAVQSVSCSAAANCVKRHLQDPATMPNDWNFQGWIGQRSRCALSFRNRPQVAAGTTGNTIYMIAMKASKNNSK
jgi:hypothetical protein